MIDCDVDPVAPPPPTKSEAALPIKNELEPVPTDAPSRNNPPRLVRVRCAACSVIGALTPANRTVLTPPPTAIVPTDSDAGIAPRVCITSTPPWSETEAESPIRLCSVPVEPRVSRIVPVDSIAGDSAIEPASVSVRPEKIVGPV